MSSARFYRRYIVKKMWLTSLRLVILRRGQFRIFQKGELRLKLSSGWPGKFILQERPNELFVNP